jgi:hypothetical protein
MVVPVALGGCWRVWLFRAWELTLALFSQSVNASWKKNCIWYRKVNNAKAIVPPGKHVVIT